jgi:hypothetical protein
MITFKDYLFLSETAAEEVAKLQGDIAMVDSQIQARTKPLQDQKMQLTKLLAIKQKQAETERMAAEKQQAQMAVRPQQTPQQAMRQQPAPAARTPGSTGQQTPGQG